MPLLPPPSFGGPAEDDLDAFPAPPVLQQLPVPAPLDSEPDTVILLRKKEPAKQFGVATHVFKARYEDELALALGDPVELISTPEGGIVLAKLYVVYLLI